MAAKFTTSSLSANPGTPLGCSLRVQAAALRAQAAALEAMAEAADSSAPRDARGEAMNLRALSAEFGFTRESLGAAARNGLAVHRGPKGRLLVFRGDVVSWIRARAWEPRSVAQARSQGETPDDALERAERELLAGDGLLTRRAKPKTAAGAQSQDSSGPIALVPPSDSKHLRSVGGAK